jgi:hypothetical protein
MAQNSKNWKVEPAYEQWRGHFGERDRRIGRSGIARRAPA